MISSVAPSWIGYSKMHSFSKETTKTFRTNCFPLANALSDLYTTTNNNRLVRNPKSGVGDYFWSPNLDLLISTSHLDPGVFNLRNPPPCCRSGNNKGGFLNKVSQKIFASGGKTPIFGRFRVFLIAVNVFKIFVFSSVTTLSTVPVLKTIYDSIWWVDSAPQAKILEIWSRPKRDFPCKNSVFGAIVNGKNSKIKKKVTPF